MDSLDVLGLGMATLDIFVRAAPPANWTPGTPLDDLAIEGGGMACNAAVAAARLGARAGFIGTCGSDALGQIKLTALRAAGVDTSHCVQRPGRDDQVVLVHVDRTSGERAFYPLAAPWRRPLDPAELEREYLCRARFLLLDGIHPAAALQAARWVRAAGGQVMLDANAHHGPPGAETRALLAECDYLVCSSGFLQALAGTPDLSAAARAALVLGPRVVVQTEGARGSHCFSADGAFHTPAFPVEALDTTSAGDVFHGALAVALLRGQPLPAALAFASAAAALKCRVLGRAGYPDSVAVEAVLSSR